MRITFLAVSLFAALLAGPNAFAIQSQNLDEPRREGKAEVVIIVCQLVGTGTPIGSPPYLVTVAGFSRSSGGAAVEVGAECAQAVASVLSAGFRLHDVIAGPISTVQYILRN